MPDVIKYHDSIFVADLHTDTLLWNRNIISEYEYGHVDIPRLLHGNVGLQVFSVVTKVPRGLNLYANQDSSDNITLLAIAQRWPRTTWTSLLQRALYQANKLQVAASNSEGQLRIIRTRQDLRHLMLQKAKREKIVGAILSLEGAHALEGKLQNLDLLFDIGFRIIGFSHFFDNELGGSAHGIQKGGISDFGLKVLQKINQFNMIVDIAHASPKLVDDIFRNTSRPVIATHTGVKGICDRGLRNLSDRHIRQIAKSGGIVGIGLWPGAICSQDLSGFIKSIRYVTNLVGEDYVALGSDFDGNVQIPLDAANINTITQALIQAEFTDVQIRKIMGDNIANVLLKSLPASLETELHSQPQL